MSNYEPGNQIIYAGDIDKQIEEYQRRQKQAIQDWKTPGVADPTPELDDWEQDELDAMLAFREQAKGAIHTWEERTSFILDDYFATWAAGEAEDFYTTEAVNSGYFDVERYAEDRKSEFEQVEYGPNTYLADGR